jgi:two-component system chemotaxis response regulator CheB
MAARDLIVVGGSAGALVALRRLLASLPSELDATFLVAIHRGPALPGAMPEVLGRHTSLPVAYAVDDEVFQPRHIYVAPPDHHLLVSGERLRVGRGPREHGFRPAIDPLFRSAAREHGPRVVGIILSGAMDDGVQGLALIKRHGGVAIVQRPEDAEHDGMPTNALLEVDVDHVLPAAELGPLLARLTHERVRGTVSSHERDVAEVGGHGLRGTPPPGDLRPFVCPECGGALWERQPTAAARFRCHVGHAFTTRTLTALQDGRLEQVLWTALRSLEEHASLRRQLAGRALRGGLAAMADTYHRQARRSEERADVLRAILVAPSAPEIEVDAAEETVAPLSRSKV